MLARERSINQTAGRRARADSAARSAAPPGKHRVGRTESWTRLIPAREWEVYRKTIHHFRDAGLNFLLGGGFCWARYTHHWRNTKDIDLYVLPHDRSRAIAALNRARFKDLFPRLPYDRGWIYRAQKDGVIVDVIWSMANRRAAVQESWFARAHEFPIRGERLRILAPEELLWCKLYVLQRDHTDWPDLLNLLCFVGPSLDWKYILKQVGEDARLLQALLNLFSWLTPSRSQKLPAWLRKKFCLRKTDEMSAAVERHRARLLDSRKWFAGAQPSDEPLAI